MCSKDIEGFSLRVFRTGSSEVAGLLLAGRLGGGLPPWNAEAEGNVEEGAAAAVPELEFAECNEAESPLEEELKIEVAGALESPDEVRTFGVFLGIPVGPVCGAATAEASSE